MYADNEYKFVAVLNEKYSVAQLINALGHMAAGLVGLSSDTEAMRFLKYEDADGSIHPGISYFPFIVLAARNGNQIRTLRAAAIDAGLACTDFVSTMLGTSASDQLQKTRATREQDLEYIGICMFGPSETLNGITRKFSLFNK